MSHHVVSPRAQADLDDIWETIAEHNPEGVHIVRVVHGRRDIQAILRDEE